MTLREILNQIQRDVGRGDCSAGLVGAGLALAKLNNSREVIEKITTRSEGHAYTVHKVTAHKARVVIDG